MSFQGTAGEAKIEGDEIVFRVPISFLPGIAKDMDNGGTITDTAVFAKELVDKLNDEDETGLTAFHRMFEERIEETINQGAEGVELEDDDDDA